MRIRTIKHTILCQPGVRFESVSEKMCRGLPIPRRSRSELIGDLWDCGGDYYPVQRERKDGYCERERGEEQAGPVGVVIVGLLLCVLRGRPLDFMLGLRAGPQCCKAEVSGHDGACSSVLG
jgi:hypothetical protein